MASLLILGPENSEATRLVDLLSGGRQNVLRVSSLNEFERVLSRVEAIGVMCFYNFEGGDVMDALKVIEKSGKKTKLVVVTDFSKSKEAAGAMSAGAFDFLPSPFDPTEVSACAARLIAADIKYGYSDEVRFEAKDGVLVLKFPQEVTFEAAANLGRLIDRGFPTPEHGIVFDLENTRYFSSSGISVLFQIYTSFEHLSDRLIISAARPHIRNTMRLAGAEQFFSFCESIEKSVWTLRNN
ncbi:MAG: STAS domain-containing protein [Planctomycetes bacterium]|nr:STAS domain-containing protein [Planctomycetota bacterium]